MHDVSLRSSINRMNAHNLAIVLTLNLLKGKNPVQDALLFSVVPALLPVATPGSVDDEDNADGRTTLGVLIELCIRRYYEVFDESRDPAEAVTTVDSSLTVGDDSIGTVASLSGSTAVDSSLLSGSADSTHAGEEEEIDDAMLVMPLGPRHSRNGSVLQGSGEKPAAWANTYPNLLPYLLRSPDLDSKILSR
jgi:Rho GTPase-activating protein 1